MKNAKMLFWVIFFFLSVFVSIFTKNVWTGLIVFISYILLSKGWDVDYLIKNRKYRVYLIRILCASVLLGFAQWLDRLGSWWIWTFVWLLASLMMIFAWILCHGKTPKWTLIFGVLGGLSALFAVISPFIDFEFGVSVSTSFFLWLVIWLILLLGTIIFLYFRFKHNDPWKSRLSYILSFLLSLIVSIVSQKYWTGLIVFAGFWLLYKDIPKIMKAALMKYKTYMFWQYSGLILIIVAMYFTYTELKWIWFPICLLAGLPFYITGAFIIKVAQDGALENKRLLILGKVEFTTCLCCILFGLTTPALLSLMPALNVYSGWLLLFPGLCLLVHASSEGLKEKSWPFLIYSAAGTLFMVAAVVVFQFSNTWIIRLFIGIGGLAIGLGALGAFLERKTVGIVGAVIAFFYIFSTVFGISFEARFYVNKFQSVALQPKLLIIPIGFLVLVVSLLLVIKMNRRKRVNKKEVRSSEIIPSELLSQLLKDFDNKKK